MKKNVRKIKRYLSKPLVIAALCFVAGITVTGAAFATVQLVQSNQKSSSKASVDKNEPKIQSNKTASPSPAPSTSSSPSPSPPTAPSSAPKPATKAPPSKSSPSYQSYHAACSKKNSDSYVKYNNSMSAEKRNHDSILAELLQAYNDGEFADAGDDEYFAYQIAVEIENDRWSDANKDIHIIHLSEMSANVCY